MTEGDFSFLPSPFQIPYGVMLPQKMTNLLVPVAISSSHVGFCGIRLEPTWSALGQAAGLAAHLAIQNGNNVTKVDVPALQALLLKNKAKLIYLSDVATDSPYFEAVQYFGTKGFFHDLYVLEEIHLVPLPVLKLQYRNAALYHDVEPTKTLDAALAERWIAKLPAARKANASRLFASKPWTRGEFMKAIFEP